MDRENASGDNTIEQAERAAMMHRLAVAPATADQDMVAASTVFYQMIGEAVMLLSCRDRADVWRRLCVLWDDAFGDPAPGQRRAVSVMAVAALHVAEQGLRATDAGDQ